MNEMINKNDLIKLGYKTHTAESIINQAKIEMVQKGFSMYSNKRLGLVPKNAVEQIIGTDLSISQDLKSCSCR